MGKEEDDDVSGKGVANFKRRTWDKAEFLAKAQSRAAGDVVSLAFG